MRHFALALVLACVLSGTAFAGEIPTTGGLAPQPSSSAVKTGEIPTTGALTGKFPSTGEGPTVLTIILTLISIVR
jgi:hypothetical protein